ncbi:MAG: ABC transporter ATP-binding protein [Pseudomonadota bacterium]
MPDPLLSVRHLDAFYGDVQVLWDISLEIYPGEVVSIIGPNGAGKSSLMYALMGLVVPRGRGGGPVVTYDGKVLDGLSPEDVVKTGITLVPEGARVFPDMSCMDNLRLGAYSLKDRDRESRLLEEVLTLFPRLRERSRQTAKTLSGGERQMLAIARALMSAPRFLLLDEPSLGLHPIMVSNIFENIEKISKRDVTVLLVEQKVTFALRMSDRAYVLENGRMVLEGPGEGLLGHEHVRKAYLSV